MGDPLQAAGLTGHVHVGRVKGDDVAVLVRHGGCVGVDRLLDVGLALDECWERESVSRS